MADYAGAKKAIEDRLAANWTTTRIAFVNKTPADPWPPKDDDGQLQPYVLCEVINTASRPAATGTPGNQTWLYLGLIHAHVFVPVNSGDELAGQHAVAIGELFRGKQFFDDVTPGCFVRTWAPMVGGGGDGSDDGLWFEVTATIPFEYWHRG
jgi:hypothetical protein